MTDPDSKKSDLPFGADYAKSNRASCKGCKQLISQNSLRLSAREPSRFFDGLQDNWFHFKCFFKRLKPGKDQINMVSIKGVDILKWEDQELIKKNILEFTTGVKGATLDNPQFQEVKAEYSKTNRGKCVKCSKKFDKGEIKLNFVSSYYHKSCLLETITFEGDVSEIGDFSSFTSEEQESLKNLVKPAVKEEKTATKRGKKTDAECAPKKGKLDKASMDLKKQSDKFWELKKGFTENLNKDDMITILDHNRQNVQKRHALDTLVDCAMFGAPRSCEKCTAGQLIFSPSKRTYRCDGSLSEYTRCTFESRYPHRIKFLIPDDMKNENSWLKSVKTNLFKERLYADFENEEVIEIFLKFILKHLIIFDPTSSKSLQTVKNGGVVDPNIPGFKKCHVHKDVNGSLYTALLTMTDASSNANSYYKLQLVAHDDSLFRFKLFRAWGRTGTEIGGNTTQDFRNEANAVKAFEQVFFEKTENHWKNRDEFEKYPGFHDYVKTDYNVSITNNVMAGEKSLLHRSIKAIMMMIFDIERMKNTLAEFEIDINKMPLGKLSSDQIKNAYAVLTDLQKVLKKRKVDHDGILDATNRFYTLIPHNFGMKKPTLLNTKELLMAKCSMLDSLLELQEAVSLISTTSSSEDPIDDHYKKLKCEMEYVEPDSNDYQLVLKYLQDTHAATHNFYTLELVDVLKLDRKGEKEKFKKELENRVLLWHGSGVTNYGGILSQGLRIAPPEAPVTGYMFGKGVYFADRISKSANYCRVTSDGQDCLLLLCEVALGKVQTATQAFTDVNNVVQPGFDSVHGVGSNVPDPAGDVITAEGYKIPLGQQKKQTVLGGSLLYNEFIVYNVDQIRMRYLVRARYNVK